VSSGTVFLVLVAGWVVLVVLWQLSVNDSLYALAVLKARLRHRWPQWRDRVALVFDRSRVAARGAARARPRTHRYLAGALAGAAVVGLAAAAVLGTRDFGPRGTVGSDAAAGPQSANPARLHPSRALAPPVPAARSRRTSQTAGRTPSPRVRHEQPTKVVSLVRVSAHVPPPASPTSSTQVASSTGPAPLPAPAGSSAPSPLAAPSP
jgi:hypothetical protein